MSQRFEFPPDVEDRLAALPDPDLDDSDNPEWTREDFARAEKVDLSLADLHARLTGEPSVTAARRDVTLTLDPKVVDFFQSQGPDWRDRMRDALTAAAG